MPRTIITIGNASHFHYKITYDDKTKGDKGIKYFTTADSIIFAHPNLTRRIIYKYTCPNAVPRERRRVKRPFWIERVKLKILRDNENFIRIRMTAVQ
tara:strand:+ start:1018 stop:1308 length:291 start_codon:yes stop_codon:yes gene_type:complete